MTTYPANVTHAAAALLDPKTIIIRRETRQRQLNVADFTDLRESLGAVGLINPIIVRYIDGAPVLVAGERRLLAALSLDWLSIPVRFFEALGEEEAEVIELEENIKRKELLWRDHVRSVGRLHNLYKTKNKTWLIEQTCAALSLHQTHLHKILRVYDALDSARIAHVESIEQAYNTLQKFAERKAESIVSDIIANGAALFSDENLVLDQSDAEGDFTIARPISVVPEPTAAPVLNYDSSTDTYLYTMGLVDELPLGVDVSGSAEHVAAALASGVRPPPQPAPQAPTAAPQAAKTPVSGPILCANFLEWAAAYEGQKFSLIHCDFPYGNYKGGDSKGSLAGTETEDFYDNHEEIYWNLLDGLTTNLDRIMSYSAHLVFWFNMNYYTETVSRLRRAGLMVHDHPLVWHKTPGGGGLGVVPGTATTYPRRTYDTALLAVHGNRPLAKPGMNSYAAPTVGNKIHPSQKPESMLRHFLSMVVDETTTVLDPTCGSAAALRAAEDLGAKSILGIEMDPNYAATAQARTLQARVMRQLSATVRED
jgi:ParB/RepB/Spo0J family partition protein